MHVLLRTEQLCRSRFTLRTDNIKARLRQSLCGSVQESISDMTPQRDKMREDVKFRIMRLLQKNPEMTQRELAKAVGISTGGIHYLLNALVNTGMLKLSNFTAAEDKRRYAYLLTSKGMSEKALLTKRYLARKRAEYNALEAEIEALEWEIDLGIDKSTSSKSS